MSSNSHSTKAVARSAATSDIVETGFIRICAPMPPNYSSVLASVRTDVCLIRIDVCTPGNCESYYRETRHQCGISLLLGRNGGTQKDDRAKQGGRRRSNTESLRSADKENDSRDSLQEYLERSGLCSTARSERRWRQAGLLSDVTSGANVFGKTKTDVHVSD